MQANINSVIMDENLQCNQTGILCTKVLFCLLDKYVFLLTRMTRSRNQMEKKYIKKSRMAGALNITEYQIRLKFIASLKS